MSVDFQTIQKRVVDDFTARALAANRGDRTSAELNIIIATISARVVSDFMEEYLKATSSDQDSL